MRPLRSARQEMKADPDMAIVRARVKAMEIEAERIEQAMLFAHARCIRSRRRPSWGYHRPQCQSLRRRGH